MKKRSKKIVKILMILMLILAVICIYNTAFARAVVTEEVDSGAGGAGGGAGSYHVGPIDPIGVLFAGSIISVVQYLCYAAAFIWVMILGVRYMSAAPDGKAELKKKLFAAFIGAIILFSVGTIITMVYNIVPK